MIETSEPQPPRMSAERWADILRMRDGDVPPSSDMASSGADVFLALTMELTEAMEAERAEVERLSAGDFNVRPRLPREEDVPDDLRPLGHTPRGWRLDRMLRNLYLSLSPRAKAVVDGDSLLLPTPLWEMVAGETVSL